MNREETPKLQRKASLSLSTRLNKKRHNASPQNCFKSSTSREANYNCETLQRSPSVQSICSDGGIECTPPHKKMAFKLDENSELSPKVFDTSFSPTCLLSQTLAIDSPEVGWKWSRHSFNRNDAICIENNSIHTPDSAYTVDNSFVSAGCSSTEIVVNEHKQDFTKLRINNNARRENQRKILEQELRRAEYTRAEENLKQRCAKLQEQLKGAGTQKSKPNSKLNELNGKSTSTIVSNSSSLSDEMKILTKATTNVPQKLQTPEKAKNQELLQDFFNDSDSDCFLLEATQEIESKIEPKTQPVLTNLTSTTPKSSRSSKCSTIPYANSAPAATSTPPDERTLSPMIKTTSANSENKDKRSSFYMKFLEDDFSDDWFISLDEAVLQATQNKKPRNSFQRYNSMPAETAAKGNSTSDEKDNNGNCIMESKGDSSKNLITLSDCAALSSSNGSKIKRYSSTHNITPAGTNFRSRRQL